MSRNRLTPSRNYRAALLAVDVGKATSGALHDVPYLFRAQARLSAVLARCEARIGGRETDGTWAFATDAGKVFYAMILKRVVQEITSFGEDIQEGLVWIVVAHGLAEDVEATARRCGQVDAARDWRIVFRVLGWMFSRHDALDEIEAVWEPSVALYERIRRAAEV